MNSDPTLSEIQTAIDAMIGPMADKGLRMPDVKFNVNANAEYTIWLRFCRTPKSFYADKSEIFRGSDANAIIAQAHAWIAALPAPETKAVTEYMKAVAETIDLGLANGIDDQYVNPLRITVQAMTENLLPAPEVVS